jgi:NDP-sugar pyrophosphorylase family protein
MIVIPMAGLSQRFSNDGFTLPKYMLEARGETVFWHAINSFRHYFEDAEFLFICRDVNHTKEFIAKQCSRLGIYRFNIIVLESPTKGQAETVHLGIEKINAAKDEPLTIFNIDTFRLNFRYPVNFNINEIDGYLEVFKGSGSNWSYVKPLGNSKYSVSETAEKNPISDLCCTGLYYFRSVNLYNNYYLKHCLEKFIPDKKFNEHYIAPIYNSLIEDGFDIRFNIINKNEVIFCGIPDEYRSFKDGI